MNYYDYKHTNNLNGEQNPKMPDLSYAEAEIARLQSELSSIQEALAIKKMSIEDPRREKLSQEDFRRADETLENHANIGRLALEFKIGSDPFKR